MRRSGCRSESILSRLPGLALQMAVCSETREHHGSEESYRVPGAIEQAPRRRV